MRIKIVVDRQACQSVASCLTLAPDIYELDEEAKAIVKDTTGQPCDGDPNHIEYIIDIDGAKLNDVIAGAETCPYTAITVYNADSNEKIFPKNDGPSENNPL